MNGELRPLVLSPGGFDWKESSDELAGRKELDEAIYDRMMTKVSLELLRSHSRLFEMYKEDRGG